MATSWLSYCPTGWSSPGSLARAVRERGAEVGFALDGDADRLIAVDASGTVNVSNLPPPENVRVTKVVHGSPQAAGESPQARNWDPSVQSLTAFPQVLLMMNDKLDWTQRLGDAFIGQEEQVMDTVQKLRARAREAGNLNSNAQQSVVDQDGSIVIEPAQDDSSRVRRASVLSNPSSSRLRTAAPVPFWFF